MGERHVMILSRSLTHPKGAVVSQEKLLMDDDQLDAFIAAGYAIEHEVAKKKGGRRGQGDNVPG